MPCNDGAAILSSTKKFDGLSVAKTFEIVFVKAPKRPLPEWRIGRDCSQNSCGKKALLKLGDQSLLYGFS